MTPLIKTGQIVVFKKRFQDPGDENFTFVCVEDECRGIVKVSPIIDLPFPPVSLVHLNMIEGF